MNNFSRMYEIIKQRQKHINSFYDLCNGVEDKEKQSFVDKLLKAAHLEQNGENKLAVITKIVTLRDENIVLAQELANIDKSVIASSKEEIFHLVKQYHLHMQEKSIQQIKAENILSPFYMQILISVHKIGSILSDIQPKWTSHVVENINKNLIKKYKNSTKALEFLEQNALLQYDENNNLADRSYSVLVLEDEKYKSKAYVEFFPEFLQIANLLDELTDTLCMYEDRQKNAYILYFKALKNAFLQDDQSKLISFWQEVDVAWMGVTSPLQVGHFLEYYEDHLRKAVAFEWDIRLDDVTKVNTSMVKDNILRMYEFLSNMLEKNDQIYERCVQNINKTSLHVGTMAFYYGAELDGLFSAQVVPNDELVTQKYGKKIFAFADNIYETEKSKPFLKIHKDVFGEEFLIMQRSILFKDETLWHKIYEISTIGHEFGHILWLDDDTQILMNKSGMFKNIEEFKATTGGLVAFFLNEKDDCKQALLIDMIKRAVGLVAWMKTSEVEPYYCEGLIHLQGLFSSQILQFKSKLIINMNDENYAKLKKWYINTYKNLAKAYLNKQDASIFLSEFMEKNDDGFFMPKDLHVRYFVNYYWKLYQEYGRVVDNEDRQKWLF